MGIKDQPGPTPADLAAKGSKGKSEANKSTGGTAPTVPPVGSFSDGSLSLCCINALLQPLVYSNRFTALLEKYAPECTSDPIFAGLDRYLRSAKASKVISNLDLANAMDENGYIDHVNGVYPVPIFHDLMQHLDECIGGKDQPFTDLFKVESLENEICFATCNRKKSPEGLIKSWKRSRDITLPVSVPHANIHRNSEASTADLYKASQTPDGKDCICTRRLFRNVRHNHGECLMMRIHYTQPGSTTWDDLEEGVEHVTPPPEHDVALSMHIPQPEGHAYDEGNKWHWQLVGAVLEHPLPAPDEIANGEKKGKARSKGFTAKPQVAWKPCGHFSSIVVTRDERVYHVTDDKVYPCAAVSSPDLTMEPFQPPRSIFVLYEKVYGL